MFYPWQPPPAYVRLTCAESHLILTNIRLMQKIIVVTKVHKSWDLCIRKQKNLLSKNIKTYSTKRERFVALNRLKKNSKKDIVKYQETQHSRKEESSVALNELLKSRDCHISLF